MCKTSLFLAAMLTEMNHCIGDRGVSVPYRMDGKFYNIRRFMAKTKTSITKFRELLYADDCALVAHSTEEMQHTVACFNNAAVSFGLQINIKKTVCFNLLQEQKQQLMISLFLEKHYRKYLHFLILVVSSLMIAP